jgi:HK97 family phage major capsid protein
MTTCSLGLRRVSLIPSNRTTNTPERGVFVRAAERAAMTDVLPPTTPQGGGTIMANSHANDAMIRRLEKELEERNSGVQAIIANAQDSERDLNDSEKETLKGLRSRIVELRSQLEELESTAELSGQIRERMSQLDQAITATRRVGAKNVEYRSAGAYMVDQIAAHNGSREALERLDVFTRAADHQLTGDNPGVIPDPIVGTVINFIDAARPIVSAIGPQALPSNTFHRPKVTQHTAVAAQGTAGAAADEKAELTSQAMTIARLSVDAVTYGGYVNVSRQNIDFSSPQVMDLIVNDLAAQYAIETESATAAALATTTTTAVEYPLSDPSGEDIAAALWSAAATVYTGTRGQGRLVLAVAADRLGLFGPLFVPVNPQNAQSTGFTAGSFGQGAVGNISGISVVMSSGLASGEAFLFSTAAVEAWEQRVGTLQVVEPSVLGVQIAYAGYFATLLVEEDGVVPISQAAT